MDSSVSARRLSGSSTVVAGQQQVSCDMNGDVVILSLKDGVYYELESVGARVWKLIQNGTTINEVRDIISEEYDVERERCEDDLQELFQDMAAKGLIEVKEAAVS